MRADILGLEFDRFVDRCVVKMGECWDRRDRRERCWTCTSSSYDGDVAFSNYPDLTGSRRDGENVYTHVNIAAESARRPLTELGLNHRQTAMEGLALSYLIEMFKSWIS